MMRYKRETIAVLPPAERVLCVAGDLKGNGKDGVLTAGRLGEQGLYAIEQTEQGWKTRLIDANYPRLEAGGLLFDVTSNGKLDFVAGGDWKDNGMYWWEQPDDPDAPWVRRMICEMPANQSHDQIMADLDGDGRPELYFWNQKSEAVFRIEVPEDPRVSPWPGGMQSVLTGVKEEGFAVADVDGDGKPELLAGLQWLKPVESGEWERNIFAEGLVSPRLVAADFSGSGRIQIAVSEGDSSFMAGRPGKLALFTAPENPRDMWEMELLHDDLLDPHSLFAADFNGNGRPDLFVGELGDPMGADSRPPCQRIFWNRDGSLEEEVIDSGLGTHEAKPIRVGGKTGIAGKPYRSLECENRGDEINGVQVWLPTD